MDYMGTGAAGEERELIRRFQSGDGRAGNELYQAYRKWLRGQCHQFRRQYEWLAFDDLLGAAQEAFALAIKNFDLGHNNGLNAYARKWVEPALKSVLGDGLRKGTGGGDGRAARWLSGAWDGRKDLPLKKIAEGAQVSIGTAKEALAAEREIREGTVVSYDSVGETGYDHSTESYGVDVFAAASDNAVMDAGSMAADDPLDLELDTSETVTLADDAEADDGPLDADEYYRALSDAEWLRYCGQRAFLKTEKHYSGVPSREVYEADQAAAFRHRCEPYLGQKRFVARASRGEDDSGLVIPGYPLLRADEVPNYWARLRAKNGVSVLPRDPSRVFAQCKPEVSSHAGRLPTGTADYEGSVATRLARFEADYRTFIKGDPADWPHNPADWTQTPPPRVSAICRKPWGTIPERIVRPVAGPKEAPRRSRRGRSIPLTAKNIRAAHDSLAAHIERDRQRRMMPGRATPLRDRDARSPNKKRFVKRERPDWSTPTLIEITPERSSKAVLAGYQRPPNVVLFKRPVRRALSNAA